MNVGRQRRRLSGGIYWTISSIINAPTKPKVIMSYRFPSQPFTGPSKYEPLPRVCHVSQSVGSRVIAQGGRTKDFSDTNKQQLSSVVEVFNPYSELWEQKQVRGDTPSPGTYLAACASLHNDLFVFGGMDGRNFFNTLHKLDTKTWCWHQLSPQNAEGAPMPKFSCEMISFGECLGVFGGFGRPHEPIERELFIRSTRYTDGSGWTNEFHIYHLKLGMFN